MVPIILSIPAAGNFRGQHKISEILSKYFEDSNRSKRQKQSYYYATERWRDVKIALMNKLYKIKSTLRSQLSGEICKPITDHKSFVEVRDNIELLISMVELAYGLPYKEDDHTTAIQFINAQLEKINSQAVFGREQDRLEMIRVLHAARVEAGNGKDLDMEILLNQVGGIFKAEKEAAGDEESLQAAYLLMFVDRLMRLEAWPCKTARDLRRIQRTDLQNNSNQIS